MARILFLCHRTPYPPNKGDKIRSYAVLRHLTQAHEVHLAYFEDDWSDRLHRDSLAELCASVCPVPLSPLSRKVLGLRSVFTGQPITVMSYPKAAIRRYVQRLEASGSLDLVYAFSGAMAAHIPAGYEGRTIFDMVDVDSEKWGAYGAQSRWPLSWIYKREYRLLRAFEVASINTAAQTLMISEEEADLIRPYGQPARPITAMPNGVDPERFYPRPSPAEGAPPTVIFTGAMDYPPNVSAVLWFAETCWPAVRRVLPDAEFVIAGAPVAPAVARLAQVDGITVTGRVPDMLPYLHRADAAIAPIDIARGVQNKVLEALACAVPVVATPEAATGLPLPHPSALMSCPRGNAFAEAVTALLSDRAHAFSLGQSAVPYVADRLSMAAMGAILDQVVDDLSA